MLAAMTHPSRVLNLDMKAEAFLCQRAISNCRQNCLGPLGLISAVLMLGWRYSYVATSNDPRHVVSFKSCQSAQTRELASMRNIYIYIDMDVWSALVCSVLSAVVAALSIHKLKNQRRLIDSL